MAKLHNNGSSINQQLSSSELAVLAKHLHELVAKSQKLKVADAFKNLGKGVSALGLKVLDKKNELDTSLTDNLGELLYAVGESTLQVNAGSSTCMTKPEFNSRLADDLVASALATLELGNTIKPPKEQSVKISDIAKVLATVDEVRCAAGNLSEAMILTAANLLTANSNVIEAINIPVLGPADQCGCQQSSLNNISSPIMIATPTAFFPVVYDTEVIGASLDEMTEILELLLHFLTLLAILLSIMPAVSCTNKCTEGAIRATMTAHGSLANGTSTFTIQWEYCCVEACFLWVTGTAWNVESSTNHTAGTPLGNNRRTAATRRAKSVGNAAATWLSSGGALPGVVRRNRITPTLIAPSSSC